MLLPALHTARLLTSHRPPPSLRRQVIGEMRAGLADWESAKRWDTLGISAQVADGSFNWSCQ